MTYRSIRTVTRVSPMPGHGILRPFPSPSLPHLDPFVFLDTAAPVQLQQPIYVGPHAHRGVQPVSLLFRGRIAHRDSLGHDREVRSGGMQWLVAGAGALHEERLHGDEDGWFHMAQLWVNVPRARKMDPPEHHAVDGTHIPTVSAGPGATARVYAGTLAGVTGPAPMPTPVLIAHVRLEAGGRLHLPAPSGWTAAFTVVRGEASVVGGEGLSPGATVVFHDDGTHLRAASAEGAELLLMLGEPIGEPVVFGAGFVMTTAAEIEQAHADLARGAMGTLRPS